MGIATVAPYAGPGKRPNDLTWRNAPSVRRALSNAFRRRQRVAAEAAARLPAYPVTRHRGRLMMNWFHALMPKEERFFDLFAQHSRAVVAGALAIRAMLEG